MKTVMASPVTTLPVPGQWALGAGAEQRAEALLEQARREGLRTGWLGPEAGFISNLDIQENLRLLHDWWQGDAAGFASHLEDALARMSLPAPAWLSLRPAQLTDSQLQQARFLRIFLLRPDVLALSPVVLSQAEPTLWEALQRALPESRFILLGDAVPGWPAWPLHDMLSASSGELPS